MVVQQLFVPTCLEVKKLNFETFFSLLTTHFLEQVIDIRDVTFQSLSNNKVLCAGAKPSNDPLPDKLLLLTSKVWHQS